MNIFLFQSTPDRFDLRQAIRPAEIDAWYATRYRNEMQPGDIVFLWMAGNESIRGCYGWGKLTSTPYLKKGWDSHGVDILYDRLFANPILAKDLRQDDVLKEMLIFRAPQSTNFLLSRVQANRLVQIIVNRGEKAPSLDEVVQ